MDYNLMSQLAYGKSNRPSPAQGGGSNRGLPTMTKETHHGKEELHLERKDSSSRKDDARSRHHHEQRRGSHGNQKGGAHQHRQDHPPSTSANPVVAEGDAKQRKKTSSSSLAAPHQEPLVSSVELAEYTLADRYDKLKLAGSGTYGSAWVVRRTEDSIKAEELARGKRVSSTFSRRKYIAKEIVLDIDGDVKRTQRRMERASTEVRVLRRLRHPNIIQYVEEIEEWDRTFIVMEYANGGDMKRLIRKQRQLGEPFAEHRILSWFAQLLLGLKCIHGCHLLHRDIKPANIFLNSDHTVLKIGDFGLTKVLTNTKQQANTVCGTPMNYAPEICRENSYSAGADMWAAGCVLFELMALEHPFQGGSKAEVFTRIVSGQLPDPDPKKVYSHELVTLVKCLLSQAPELRPTASEALAKEVVLKTLLRLEEEGPSAFKPTRSPSAKSGQTGGGTTTGPSPPTAVAVEAHATPSPRPSPPPSSRGAAAQEAPPTRSPRRVPSVRKKGGGHHSGSGSGSSAADEEDEHELLMLKTRSDKDNKTRIAAIVASLTNQAGTPAADGKVQPPLRGGKTGMHRVSPPPPPPPQDIAGKNKVRGESPPPPATAEKEGTRLNPRGQVHSGSSITRNVVSPHSPMAHVRRAQSRDRLSRGLDIPLRSSVTGGTQAPGSPTPTAKRSNSGLHQQSSQNPKPVSTYTDRPAGYQPPGAAGTIPGRGGGGSGGKVLPSIAVEHHSPIRGGGGGRSRLMSPAGGGGGEGSDDEMDIQLQRKVVKGELQHQRRRSKTLQKPSSPSFNAPSAGSGRTPGGLHVANPSSQQLSVTSPVGDNTSAGLVLRPPLSPVSPLDGGRVGGETSTSMTRQELDVWITKHISSSEKRRHIRKLLTQGSGGASPSSKGDVVLQRQCDTFDEIVAEMGEHCTPEVHIALLGIVFAS